MKYCIWYEPERATHSARWSYASLRTLEQSVPLREQLRCEVEDELTSQSKMLTACCEEGATDAHWEIVNDAVTTAMSRIAKDAWFLHRHFDNTELVIAERALLDHCEQGMQIAM